MKLKLLFTFILIVALVYIYFPLVDIGFAKVDDNWMLIGDPLVQAESFNLGYIKAVFLEINNLTYSPLNTFYYYFIYQIDGFNPYYYHLFSFLVHVSNVFLTFMLAKKLLEAFKISNAVMISLATALIWAILPFNVESVVWVSASKIVLYTFWGHISLICFITAYLKPNKLYYFASLVSFTLSFLSKEQAVLYPLMMCLFVYAYQLKFHSKLSVKSLFISTSPFIFLALLFGLMTIYVAVYGEGSHHVDRYPFGQRIILSFYCIYFYISNCFLPMNLHYHYPFPMKVGRMLPSIYYIYPVFAVVVGWLAYKVLNRSENKWIYIMCFGIFLINLLLTIQIFPLERAAMLANRYMYISSIGLLLFFFTALNEKMDLSFKKLTLYNSVIIIFFVFYILALCFYSHILVNNWKHVEL